MIMMITTNYVFQMHHVLIKKKNQSTANNCWSPFRQWRIFDVFDCAANVAGIWWLVGWIDTGRKTIIGSKMFLLNDPRTDGRMRWYAEVVSKLGAYGKVLVRQWIAADQIMNFWKVVRLTHYHCLLLLLVGGYNVLKLAKNDLMMVFLCGLEKMNGEAKCVAAHK